jgi:hypothetical protein
MMGVAMGLLFALILTVMDQFGVARLIDHTADYRSTLLVFLGTIVTTFGIGAALTALVFIMTEDA